MVGKIPRIPIEIQDLGPFEIGFEIKFHPYLLFRLGLRHFKISNEISNVLKYEFLKMYDKSV